MLSVNSTVVASKEPVFSHVGEDVVLLNPTDGKYYGLNPIGARIWTLLQQPILVSQLLATLLDEYDVEPHECERDLLEILGQLAEQSLIELSA